MVNLIKWPLFRRFIFDINLSVGAFSSSFSGFYIHLKKKNINDYMDESIENTEWREREKKKQSKTI